MAGAQGWASLDLPAAGGAFGRDADAVLEGRRTVRGARRGLPTVENFLLTKAEKTQI